MAIMLYRLLEADGFDVSIATGRNNYGQAHAWVSVKIAGQFYSACPTNNLVSRKQSYGWTWTPTNARRYLRTELAPALNPI